MKTKKKEYGVEFINIDVNQQWLPRLLEMSNGKTPTEKYLALLIDTSKNVRLKPAFKGTGVELHLTGKDDTDNADCILVLTARDVRSVVCVAHYVVSDVFQFGIWDREVTEEELPF